MLLKCFKGSRLQDELALLVHLQLLHLHGPLSVRRWRSSVPDATAASASLRHRVPHMTHLDTEGELMT